MLHPGRGIFLPLDVLERIPACVMVYLAFGELRGRLEREIRDRGLGDRVCLRGPVPYRDLLGYTAGADVGLALQEPLSENHRRARPNKVFEYIMAGVPVVASDLPPLRKAIETHGVGLVADVNDLDDVVEKVRRILEDEGLRRAMVARCREAASRFCWEADEPVLLPAISRLLPRTPSDGIAGPERSGESARPGEGA
jgi:glycosyltransferase involved in cell wall biosynthesis